MKNQNHRHSKIFPIHPTKEFITIIYKKFIFRQSTITEIIFCPDMLLIGLKQIERKSL